MPTFRKRPVDVEMLQWTGDNLAEMVAFAPDGAVEKSSLALLLNFWCEKSRALVSIDAGDWIAKERDGVGYYPLSEADQAAGYEPILWTAPPDDLAARVSEMNPVERIRRALAGLEVTPLELTEILAVGVEHLART